MQKNTGDIRIGISGWTYPPWRKVFFPEDLPQRAELEYAARAVSSIEVNGTFYSLQRASSFSRWHDSVPDDFIFSLKGPRFITHILRLEDPRIPLANFFASGLLNLGEKLGPILWQMPPSFKYDPARLETFFKLLPRNTDEVAKLARKHDDHLPGRAVLKPSHDGKIRHSFEIRHSSFENEEFIALLRHHDIAIVVADTAKRWPLIEDLTSDFVYVRLHGDEELYASGYTPAALDQWEKKIRGWSQGGTPEESKLITAAPDPRASGRDVFVYFDNDIKVHAPFDAISLGQRLGIEPRYEEPPPGRPGANVEAARSYPRH